MLLLIGGEDLLQFKKPTVPRKTNKSNINSFNTYFSTFKYNFSKLFFFSIRYASRAKCQFNVYSPAKKQNVILKHSAKFSHGTRFLTFICVYCQKTFRIIYNIYYNSIVKTHVGHDKNKILVTTKIISTLYHISYISSYLTINHFEKTVTVDRPSLVLRLF